jgi:hypothetical protein
MVEMLTYKRKSGLSLIFAHQYWNQVEDPFVRQGIRALTKIKVVFNQPDPQDRMETVKELYGGELKDRDVSYSLSNLRKQHAVIKLGKDAPAVIRIPDVPDPDPHTKTKEFIETLYKDERYRSTDDIIKEHKERFNLSTDAKPRPHIRPPRKRDTDKQTTHRTPSPRPKTLFDD